MLRHSRAHLDVERCVNQLSVHLSAGGGGGGRRVFSTEVKVRPAKLGVGREGAQD